MCGRYGIMQTVSFIGISTQVFSPLTCHMPSWTLCNRNVRHTVNGRQTRKDYAGQIMLQGRCQQNSFDLR
jgi:hypothetical protein